MKHFLVVFAFLFAALTGLQPLAQAASSPCNGPNGSLFNLAPRPNAWSKSPAPSLFCPTRREIMIS
jgi:hypothetical protein